jgi:hypothetical protein
VSTKLSGRRGVPASVREVGEVGEAEHRGSGGIPGERDVQALTSLTGPRRARPIENVLVEPLGGLGVAGRG